MIWVAAMFDIAAMEDLAADWDGTMQLSHQHDEPQPSSPTHAAKNSGHAVNERADGECRLPIARCCWA